MHRLLAIFILWGIYIPMSAQLECNGSIYRVIEKDIGNTTLQKVHIDNENDRLQLVDLKRYEGHQLNAICYKPDAQSIYGIKYAQPYQLFRIGDDLKLDLVRELPLPTNLHFVAGDIMPDGQHMVVLGFGTEEDSNVLAIIDLDDPQFETTLIPLKSVGEDESVVCADIAFHPTTGLLYGFDQRSNKMIRIDIEERSIHLFDDVVSNQEIGVVPSLFFDFDGRLYGFTIPSDHGYENLLIEFDKEDGTGQERFHTNEIGSQDACSCPYQIEMYQTINNVNQYLCTEAQFTIKLVNRTNFIQAELSLIDTLPRGMTLKSIDYNPFEGVTQLSGSSKVLAISDFVLPIGVDSIVYTVSIEPDVTPGYYENQSWLIKENPDIRSNLIKPLASDDPTTLVDEDATGFLVQELDESIELRQDILCVGSELSLNPNLLGVKAYSWNSGSTESMLTIDEPGIYEVDLTTACGQGSIEFDIRGSEISIDLGEDRVVDPNESIQIIPEVYSSSLIETTIWQESDNTRVMGCYTCTETTAVVPHDMTFTVTMQNEDGCRASGDLFVSVEPVKHYFANGFSPNGDGQNDVFFLQSKKNYTFYDFSIHDRWGNRLFHAESGKVNDPSFGWDGKAGNQALKPGVFIWSAKILGFDGTLTDFHGDVTLVR